MDMKWCKKLRRDALLFFVVIHQISRSCGLKNLRFESNLSKIIRPVAAIKSLRFALLTTIFYIVFLFYYYKTFFAYFMGILRAPTAYNTHILRHDMIKTAINSQENLIRN